MSRDGHNLVLEPKCLTNLAQFIAPKPIFREVVFPKHLLNFCSIHFGCLGHLNLTVEQHGFAVDLLGLSCCKPFHWLVLLFTASKTNGCQPVQPYSC